MYVLKGTSEKAQTSFIRAHNPQQY